MAAAERRVGQLTTLRDRIIEQLRNAGDELGRTLAGLAPLTEERASAEEQRASDAVGPAPGVNGAAAVSGNREPETAPRPTPSPRPRPSVEHRAPADASRR